MPVDAIVVGGGLAGLACARHLHARRRSVLLLEANDRIGGRVRTDEQDGFLLDHGFQVLQTAYPEAKRQLNYAELGLRCYAPGVAVRFNRRFHVLADPMRSWKHILSTLLAPIGTINDRLRILSLYRRVCRGTLSRCFDGQETTTMDVLVRLGFSQKFIRRFFIPFFGGVCLDPRLNASSRVFQYVFRMFAQGHAAIPESGMEQISRQMASHVPQDAIRTGQRVIAIDRGSVQLESGRSLTAKHVVLATEAPETCRLLGEQNTKRSFGELCLYFSADRPPVHDSFLVLNGEGRGPINNVALPSLVSPRYAPHGKTLVSAVVLQPERWQQTGILNLVRDQLIEWFGNKAMHWRHLKTFHISHALPDQRPPTADPYERLRPATARVHVCGEYQSLPGLQWALRSGRLAAQTVIDALEANA